MSEFQNADEARRRDAAATWLVRLEQPEATEGDWLAFEQWLSDPRNKRALDAVESAMLDVEQLAPALRTRAADARATRTARKPRFAPYLAFAALAAALIVAIGLWLSTPTQHFAYAAPATATRAVVLPDGSEMTLNRSAAVRVSWSGRSRRIELEKGEAAFAVRHNADAPFTVVAGASVVRDIGTEFNVLREQSALTVTVKSGSISLFQADQTATAVAGEQVRVEDGVFTRGNVTTADAFAWREGRLVYHDAPLSAIVADLNRYSSTPFNIADGRLNDLRFTGVLMIGEPAQMASQLQAFLPVRTEQNARGIVLKAR